VTETMDAGLREYLLRKIPDLKKVTNCNDELLDKMVSQSIFTSVEKEEIVSIL